MKHYFSIKKMLLPGFIFFISVLYPAGVHSEKVINTQMTRGVTEYAPISLVSTLDALAGDPKNTLSYYIEPTVVAPKKAVAKKVQAVPAGPLARPARLVIPKIGVNAYVEHLGLTPQGAIDVPDGSKNVAWFTGSAQPGNNGSSIIVGHSGIWKNGNHSVFDNLKTLKLGDTINVKDANNNTLTFVVKAMKVYGKDAAVPELFSGSGTNLNLITCYGTWLPSQQTYDRRLIVYTELQS